MLWALSYEQVFFTTESFKKYENLFQLFNKMLLINSLRHAIIQLIDNDYQNQLRKGFNSVIEFVRKTTWACPGDVSTNNKLIRY